MLTSDEVPGNGAPLYEQEKMSEDQKPAAVLRVRAVYTYTGVAHAIHPGNAILISSKLLTAVRTCNPQDYMHSIRVPII